MRLLVYDMLVNVNGTYYVHVCEQARWARSAGNSAIENVCIIIIIIKKKKREGEEGEFKYFVGKSLQICIRWWQLFQSEFLDRSSYIYFSI